MLVLLEVLSLIFICQTVAFGLSVWLERNSIADLFWGVSIALGALYIALPLGLAMYNYSPVLLLLNPITLSGLLIAVWGLRLSFHIGTRFIKKKTEDPRYAAMSRNWKRYYLRSFLQVFLLQGGLMGLMLSGLVTMANTSLTINLYTLGAGAALWLLGFSYETIADFQRCRFNKTKQPGQIMQRGLWRYSRHPNYFGEVLLWWGLWVITLPTPYWYLTLIPPVTITMLILKVSGVPMAEARYQNNAEFQAYKKRTSAFIPWWPKRGH